MKNKDAVEKWLKALRSGEFKQAKEVLYDKKTGGYCCLGVACVIAKREGVIPKQTQWSHIDCCGDTEPAVRLDNNHAKVREWFGLKDNEGGYGGNGLGLAHMNDNGADFWEIADIIESEPEGLFE